MLLTYESVTVGRYELPMQFMQMEGALDVLIELYGPDNFIQITEIYKLYAAVPF